MQNDSNGNTAHDLARAIVQHTEESKPSLYDLVLPTDEGRYEAMCNVDKDILDRFAYVMHSHANYLEYLADALRDYNRKASFWLNLRWRIANWFIPRYDDEPEPDQDYWEHSTCHRDKVKMLLGGSLD